MGRFLLFSYQIVRYADGWDEEECDTILQLIFVSKPEPLKRRDSKKAKPDTVIIVYCSLDTTSPKLPSPHNIREVIPRLIQTL